MSKDNIIDFGDIGKSQSTEATAPDNYIYSITVRTPSGGTEVVECSGYLIATSAFVGICRGPYGNSEFHFICPMENVIYSKSLRADPLGGATSKTLNS